MCLLSVEDYNGSNSIHASLLTTSFARIDGSNMSGCNAIVSESGCSKGQRDFGMFFCIRPSKM